jgi:hypothetical protein
LESVRVSAEERIAKHILDQAAVANEHGDEMLADMLTAEANALRDGHLLELVNMPGTGKAHTHGVSGVESLRESAGFRAKRLDASAKAEGIVAECWLREGFTQPEG